MNSGEGEVEETKVNELRVPASPSVGESRDNTRRSRGGASDVLAVIRQHYAFLVENIQLDLSTFGKDDEVLTSDERQSLAAERSSHARNVRLLNICIRNCHIQLDQFTELLVSTGQQYIHDYVTFQQGIEL